MSDKPQRTAVLSTSRFPAASTRKTTLSFKENRYSCNPFSRFFSYRRPSSPASGVSNPDSGVCIESSKPNTSDGAGQWNPDYRIQCQGGARRASFEHLSPTSVTEVLGQVEISVEEVPILGPSRVGATTADSISGVFAFPFVLEAGPSNLYCKGAAQAPKSSKQNPFSRILASIASLEEKLDRYRVGKKNKKELKKRQQSRRRSSIAHTKAIDKAHRQQIALHREREKKRNERSKQKIKEENRECKEKERRKRMAEKQVQREKRKERLD